MPDRWVAIGAVILLGEVIEPVRTAVYDGQVDVVLMALVVLDVLVIDRCRPRGLLIGVAAAVKLTPAVFVLYLLLRRDYRGAVTASLSFACLPPSGGRASTQAPWSAGRGRLPPMSQFKSFRPDGREGSHRSRSMETHF